MTNSNTIIKAQDFIICRVCGTKLRSITNTHLIKHSLTVQEYKLKFPDSLIVCKSISKILSKMAPLLDNAAFIKGREECLRQRKGKTIEEFLGIRNGELMKKRLSNSIKKVRSKSNNAYKTEEYKVKHSLGVKNSWKKVEVYERHSKAMKERHKKYRLENAFYRSCVVCDKKFFTYRTNQVHCSRECVFKDPTVRKKLSDRMIGNKNPVNKEGVKKKISKSIKKFLLENPEKHPIRILAKRSAKNGTRVISKKQKQLFDLIKPYYKRAELEYPVKYDKKLKFLDIGIPNFKIDVEFDSLYFHKKRQQEDLIRDNLLIKYGWKVIRVREGYVKIFSKKFINDPYFIQSTMDRRVVIGNI